MLCLLLPGPAAAYRCGSTEFRDGAQATAMFQECRAEPPARRPAARTTKRGSMSSLTVLVLAIAAISLIPIGARGIPSSIDPFRYEEPYE